MDYFVKNYTDEEIAELMAKVGFKIKDVVDNYVSDEESALAVASMLLKYSMSIFRGTLDEQEIQATLEYAVATLKKCPPIIPSNRTLN
jgi:phytoene dehydrogenase-like protein